MEEKINLYMAETTRGKLRLENCENLVRQAALHKNVLLPAKERSEEALNFGGTHEITAGSRARMQVRAVRERERASAIVTSRLGQLDLAEARFFRNVV
jgi:hypothetical protein